VFTCSVRPGTPLSRQVAGKELALVPHDEAASRASMLAELGGRMERRFASSFIGRELQVLFEDGSCNDDGTMKWGGYSGNYLRVDVDAPIDSDRMKGVEYQVLIEGLSDDLHLRGRLLS